MRVMFVLLFGLCCSMLLGQEPKEDPIKEFLEKVQKNYYFPQDFGLKDLKATLVFEDEAMMGPQKIKATYYWKQPDKSKVEFDFPIDFPKYIPKQVRAMIKRYLVSFAKEKVIPKKPLEIYQEEKDTWKYELKKENDQWVLIKTPTEKAENPGRVKEIKHFYDKDYLLVKSIYTSATSTDTLSFKYITKEKKKLLSEYDISKSDISTETGHMEDNGSIKLRLSYKQIDKIWLLEKYTIELETELMGQTMSQTITVTIEDHEVNKGIDDKIFEEEPEKEPKEEHGK